jgi:hypothetical protein
VSVGPRTVYPVIVAGGGFPVSPITSRCIHEYCTSHGLLDHAMVKPLALIDLSELEALEGLSAEGKDAITLLNDWKASTLAEVSLRNYLLATYPWSPERYRPARVRPNVDNAFGELAARLRFRPDPS